MRYFMLSVVMPMALATACATTPETERLVELDRGLSRAETIERLGASSTAVRGSLENKYGQTVEVLEYTPAQAQSPEQGAAAAARTDDPAGLAAPAPGAAADGAYWLYFVDDTLVRWGRAGDWDETAERIYQIHFGPGDRLH